MHINALRYRLPQGGTGTPPMPDILRGAVVSHVNITEWRDNKARNNP